MKRPIDILGLLLGGSAGLSFVGLSAYIPHWFGGVAVFCLLKPLFRSRPKREPRPNPVKPVKEKPKTIVKTEPKPVPTIQQKLEAARRKLAAILEFAEQETDPALRRAIRAEGQAAYRREVKQITSE
jgi:hypothetical protein